VYSALIVLALAATVVAQEATTPPATAPDKVLSPRITAT
jgi:hypothetical protein